MLMGALCWVSRRSRFWFDNFGLMLMEANPRYDVFSPGSMEPHREFLKFARSIPVSIITAHVVQGIVAIIIFQLVGI